MANKNDNTQQNISDEVFTKFVLPIYGKYESVKSDSEKSIFDSCREVQICETILGTGTIVGDYLITAAHIFNGYRDPFIKFDEKEVLLTTENLLLKIDAPKGKGIEVYSDLQCGDIAIYRITSIFSPIVLADSFPMIGHKLDNRFFCSQFKDGIDTVGIVSGDDGKAGNFFTCEMKPHHPNEGGSSGSPLIKGNKLYGVLHDGKDQYCLFYATIAESIEALIEKYKNEIHK